MAKRRVRRPTEDIALGRVMRDQKQAERNLIMALRRDPKNKELLLRAQKLFVTYPKDD